MFVRFSLKIGMFTTQHHWEMVLRSWSEAFSATIDSYYRLIHPKYDPSSNMPYTVFFDTHFSNRLYFEILDVEYARRESLKDCREFVRIDQVDIKNIEYYYEDLHYNWT